MQEMCVRNAMGIPKSDPIAMLKSTSFSGRTGLTMCDVLHPERNSAVACDVHFLDVLPQLFRRSIGVYLPVYAASTVAVQRASILKRPLHFATKMLSGALRSSVFLTVYVAAAHRGMSQHTLFAAVPPPTLFISLDFSRKFFSRKRANEEYILGLYLAILQNETAPLTERFTAA